MPKPRIGEIPKTRLSDARKVRDKLTEELKGRGYATLSIYSGGYSVYVHLLEKVELSSPIPPVVDEVPVKIRRIRK